MRGRARVLVLTLVVVAAAASVVAALHYVPFDAPSYLTWLGIVATLTGVASSVRPLRFLRLRTRRGALMLALCSGALVVAAVLWPVPVVRSERPHQRLDDFLPEYQFGEVHEARVRASAEAVIKAMREVRLADMPAVVLLLRIRAAAGGNFGGPPPDSRPLLEKMIQPGSGFLALDQSGQAELVYGMVGFVHKPKPPITTPEEFMAFVEPGGIRVAFNLRVVPENDGMVRLSTETRCLANGDEARRTFAGYWRLIYPGSAIIRRVWLDAIADRAVRDAQGGGGR